MTVTSCYPSGGLPRHSRPLGGGLGRHRRLIVSTPSERTEGRSAGAGQRANILPPLAHIAFLVTWQDELAAFAPAPALIIANLAVSRRWAWFANLAIAGGAILLVGVSGLYYLLLGLLGEGAPLPSAILVLAAGMAAPATRDRRLIRWGSVLSASVRIAAPFLRASNGRTSVNLETDA